MTPTDAVTKAGRVPRVKPLFVHQDRPAPGRGYVVANGVLLAALVALTAGLMLLRGVNFGTVVALTLALLTAAYVLLVIHAAYNTVYTLSGGTLDLCCGVMMRGEVILDDVERIEPVRALPRVTGRGPSGRSYGNRFSNGLRLVTTNGDVYVTPSKPEVFADLLRQHRDKVFTANDHRTTP